MRILVVDDSNFQRRHIVKLLPQQLGVHIFEAADGQLGLDCARKQLPDLLLTDWNMPNMNGLQLVEAVRALPELARMKIVMITTENEPWSVKQAIVAGADDYLMKPFDGESLRTKLQSLYGSEHPVFGETRQLARP